MLSIPFALGFDRLALTASMRTKLVMGEIQSANCGFHTLHLAFLPSVYIISEKKRIYQRRDIVDGSSPDGLQRVGLFFSLNFLLQKDKKPCKTRLFATSYKIVL